MKENIENYLKKHFLQIIGLMLLMSFKVLLSLGMPVVLQKFIDFMPQKIVKILLELIVIYFVGYIIQKMLSVLIKYISEEMGWSFFNQVRIWIIKKFIKYDHVFFTEYSVGELIEYTERDISILYSFCTSKLIDMILNLVLILGILVIFFDKNIYIGILFLGYVVLAFAVIYKMINTQKDSLEDYTKVTSYNIGKYGEWIHARKDINVLGYAGYIRNKMELLNEEYKKKEIKAQRYLYRIWSTTLFLVAVADVIFLFVNGKLYLKGALSIGTVYLMYSYCSMLKEPFENFQVQLQMLMQARNAYKRLEKIAGYKSEVSEGDLELCSGALGIQANELTYVYNGSATAALESVSFAIKPNEVIGVMGKSGSGKSTLCKLLGKMLEPTSGELFIGGVDIRSVSINTLREKLVYFSTNAQLMNGTLRENILLYNDEISDKEILDTLTKCNVMQYFKPLGEDFLDLNVSKIILSEGQKQLINLIRLLFRECSIIILDEASSKMDYLIQRNFEYILEKLRKRCTIIIVSHDINTLRMCDKIAIFEESKLIEFDYKDVLEKIDMSVYQNSTEQNEVIL